MKKIVVVLVFVTAAENVEDKKNDKTNEEK